jgi:DNA-binding GntR family transcriptional regulator
MNHNAHIAIDEYVLDVLMPDLTRHDRAPSAFLVYLAVWTALFRLEQRQAALSLQQLAENTGLSKSAVQAAIRLLKRRGLLKVTKTSATAVPQYELVRHWLQRRAKSRRPY